MTLLPSPHPLVRSCASVADLGCLKSDFATISSCHPSAPHSSLSPKGQHYLASIGCTKPISFPIMAAFAPLQVNAASKAYFDGLDYERDFTNRHDIYGEDAFSLVGGITEYSFDVMCFKTYPQLARRAIENELSSFLPYPNQRPVDLVPSLTQAFMDLAQGWDTRGLRFECRAIPSNGFFDEGHYDNDRITLQSMAILNGLGTEIDPDKNGNWLGIPTHHMGAWRGKGMKRPLWHRVPYDREKMRLVISANSCG